MFKFVNADGRGGTPKRQQSQRACSPCRKRKKRCHHHIGENPKYASKSPERDLSPNEHSSSTVRSNGQDVNAINVQGVSPMPIELPVSGFENPSSRARNQQSTPTYPRTESLGARFIGDLNPESVFLAASSPDATRGISLEDSVGVWLRSTLSKKLALPENSIEQSHSNLLSGSTSILQEALLPMLQQECLETLPPGQHLAALSKIYYDVMHPILPIIDVEENVPEPATHCSILLQQAICLAASKNFAARKHLVLPGSESVLSQMDFGDRISRAMRISMELGLVTDKIVLVQALTMMSQFFDSPDRGDLASQFCSRAVHHVHSIGLHSKPRSKDSREQYGTTLLCCVWAIDRMNAAFNGRPVLMHERDMRRDFMDCIDQQPPTFRLILEVIKLLDKVIDLYRPAATPNTELGAAYLSFEELVIKCGAESVRTSLITTIETLYHAITILSYRSKALNERSYSSYSHSRQLNSTSILATTIGSELQDMVLFPFIPYALSLALSVAYREMRYGQIPLHRARARKQFQCLSDSLMELKACYRSAAYIGDMGNKLLKEMDRVSGTKTPLQVPQGGNPSRPAVALPDPPAAPASNPPYDASRPFMESATTFDPVPVAFDPEMDVFGMFDPGFDLDNFDAYLESTLNPSFPTTF